MTDNLLAAMQTYNTSSTRPGLPLPLLTAKMEHHGGAYEYNIYRHEDVSGGTDYHRQRCQVVQKSEVAAENLAVLGIGETIMQLRPHANYVGMYTIQWQWSAGWVVAYG